MRTIRLAPELRSGLIGFGWRTLPCDRLTQYIALVRHVHNERVICF